MSKEVDTLLKSTEAAGPEEEEEPAVEVEEQTRDTRGVQEGLLTPKLLTLFVNPFLERQLGTQKQWKARIDPPLDIVLIIARTLL